ncbi:MAG TPA: Ig-like domain-containing protein [Methylomirabilota bacterium]|nr:Ig-like domain-containing protein [Methylomirabilota bacterium]
MFKKIVLSLSAIALLAGSLTFVYTAIAAGTNLINNPSVETANAAGTAPTSWSQTKSGSNTTTFSYKTTEGHAGTKSLYVNMTKRTGGNAEWKFTSVAVKPNQKYTYTEYYKSNVATTVDLETTTTANKVATKSLGSVTASPTNWQSKTYTFTTPANIKTLSVFHLINKVGWLQTDDFNLVEGDGTVTPPPAPTAPAVTITAPAANATVSGTQAVSATATDKVGVSGVQFKVDGTNIGAEDVTAPYSVNLDTKTLTNAMHTITATARNASSLTAVATRTITVKNPTPPSVSITNPVSGATVSGTSQQVTAAASDAQGITNVQFKLDGNNLGSPDTTAPYAATWNTSTTANGSHTLSAVATNKSSLATTSTPVPVTVQNIVTPPPATPPAGPNLIANPSFETANGAAPANWLSSNWGTNTAAFSYLNTGHTGSHSVKAEITNYTNGAANWYYADIPVTTGKTYKYENWYQSNVDTEVDAEIVMNDGTVQYAWLGTVFASTNWAKFSTTFTAPAGAKSIAIYQILAKTGYIVSDDYSLGEYTPVPLNRGLVSVTFDDGWANQYTNALPLLGKYGLPATFYIISDELTDQPDYMSAAQVKNLSTAGHEIGSHSVTHPDLTTVSQANLIKEMSQSQTVLQNLVGKPVTDFAYPFGAYNANTIAVGKQYYQSQRTVNGGFNTKDNFDLTTLKIYEVDSNISQAQVKGWIDAAIAQKSWLVLVYHETATTPTDPTDDLYTTQPADLDAELAYIKNSGVATVTVNQAINEILSQP